LLKAENNNIITYSRLLPNQNQTFHYNRRIRPKRVTSLRCPLDNNGKGNTATFVDA